MELRWFKRGHTNLISKGATQTKILSCNTETNDFQGCLRIQNTTATWQGITTLLLITQIQNS